MAERFRGSMGLSFNINFQSGFKLYCEMIIPDDDVLKPALRQGFIKDFQASRVLFDKILQIVDAGNLCVSGGSKMIIGKAFMIL